MLANSSRWSDITHASYCPYPSVLTLSYTKSFHGGVLGLAAHAHQPPHSSLSTGSSIYIKFGATGESSIRHSSISQPKKLKWSIVFLAVSVSLFSAGAESDTEGDA